jgi:hypothetical protein
MPPLPPGRRTRVEHDQRATGHALHHVQRPKNGAQVEDRRPRRHQHQIGQRGDMHDIGFDARPGIDHRQIDAILSGGV